MHVPWSAVFLNADHHSDFTSSLGQRSAGYTEGRGPLGRPTAGVRRRQGREHERPTVSELLPASRLQPGDEWFVRVAFLKLFKVLGDGSKS